MIAVTGAAGFIGSNLARRLAADGRDLLLVDHPLTPAKLANWAGLKAFRYLGHERFLAALADGSACPQALFHLGACSSTTETDWDYLRRNNVEYTRSLWQWCAENRVPFVYASSAATYGDGSRGFSDRTPPAELKPLNLYGQSKNDFDIWAIAEVAAGRPAPPRWAGLKFFNVYGPHELHKGRMASVVWQAYKQIRETGAMRLFASADPAVPDGGQTRDFVFAGDCVDQMLWHAASGEPGVYNCGTGEPRTFLDLTKATFAAMGLGPAVEFIPMPADLVGKYQNYTRADRSKLVAAGYGRTPTGLEEGVRRTVEWLRASGA